MEKDKVIIVTLHDKPNLIGDCIRLLNDEWPKSKIARMRSIENSNANLPISLLLINDTQQNKCEVIGHAKISRLPLEPGKCLIQSVLVNPANRGKGFGKLLMNECEKLAVQFGFSTILLSTYDKKEFYQKLGYEFCQASHQCGIPLSVASHLLDPTKYNKSSDIMSEIKSCYAPGFKDNSTSPQPPPLPQFTNTILPAKKVYMKKSLKQ